MPANVSMMYGVSPPFPNERSFLNLHNHTCYSASYVPSETCFSRVPKMDLKNPKSCLKLSQRQSPIITECLDLETSMSKDGDKQTNVESETESFPKTKKGKRVTFADRNGGVLTLIKYLTESTHEPPKSFTSGNFLKDLMENMQIKSKETPNDANLKLILKFNQPVADCMKFKLKVEKLNVSLENVAIKSHSSVHGTVKVKNIAFEKTVNLRISFNDWQTSADVPCDYVNNAYDGGVFDTFQFTIEIPTMANQVQFCIRYQCCGKEFWDNNDGGNYVISRANNLAKSSPVTISGRHSWTQSRPYPSTYGELPSPQERTWLPVNRGTPFY